jgi:hypothetical protein
LRGEITVEIFEVEVLRASPVKITGVPKPDLVGCAEDDRSMVLCQMAGSSS